MFHTKFHACITNWKILRVICWAIFRNYHPLEKGGALHLNKLETPSPKCTLCHIWLKLAQCFWRRGFYNILNIFLLFRNYSPWKRSGPFIWTKFNTLHPKMLCAKFSWNWPSGSWEEVENRKKFTDRRTEGQTDRHSLN